MIARTISRVGSILMLAGVSASSPFNLLAFERQVNPIASRRLKASVCLPCRSSPLLHGPIMLRRGRGECHIGYCHGAALIWKRGFDPMRMTFDPAPDRFTRDRSTAAAFQGPADVSQMRRKRFERDAVSMRMLQAVRVDEQPMHPEVGRIAEVLCQHLVHDRLAARGAIWNGQSAAVASIRGLLIRVHRLV